MIKNFFICIAILTNIYSLDNIKKYTFDNDINIISLLNSKNSNSIKVIVDNIEQNSTISIYPSDNIKTATLFFIDSSIPMKTAFESSIKDILVNLYKQKSQYDKYATFTFDSKIDMINSFDDDNITSDINNIKIDGQNTELFRLSLDAMDELAKRSEVIKYFVIFSDGEYEDKAYNIEDLIKKATDNNITILSVGYKDSIFLQSLRRLSDETNGKIWVANKNTYKVDANFTKEFSLFYTQLVNIKIDDILKPNESGKVEVEIKINDESNNTLSKKILFDVEKVIINNSKDNKIIIISVILIVLILIIIIAFKLKSKKQQNKKRILAYLQTDFGDKLEIYNYSTSIGSSLDNDIVIQNEYISRNHAIIDFQDGKFSIIDRNSTNGIVINEQKVSKGNITSNDIIYFGPYKVIFIIQD
jgi:hypothetical protein